jgi:hypothetical protein
MVQGVTQAAPIGNCEIFNRAEWQMSLGERAALEGLVAQAKPQLAIEIGTAEGGSLERIAAHSAEVHAIDLTRDLLVRCPPNAKFHEGDSKLILPEVLARFAAEGRNVDFVLVDGDHSPEGVQADLTILLESPAVGSSIILLHDAFNPDVRRGIELVPLASLPKVAGFDLDFVPGRLAKLGPFADQLLGGLALVIVDDRAASAGDRAVELGFWSLRPEPVLFHDGYETLRRAPQLIDGNGATTESVTTARLPLDAANIARVQLERELAAVQASASWRITAPLRRLKRGLARPRER